MLTMRYYHKFAIIGLIVGIFPIIFGIIALTTSTWIRVFDEKSSQTIVCDLFAQFNQSSTNKDATTDTFQIPQYFEIIGCIILQVGLVVGVLCTALINKRSVHFIPPVILMIGTVMIFLGLIFYIQYVVDRNGALSIKKLHLGYSMILMIATCVIGCFMTAYFSFTAGYIHRHILAGINIH
ncbi:unnamed protein product [Rotaria socialis]|uniref:Uncharacterized protein n=2 Tax=Rotaria socialis TaxID=392032 RepID=A0A820PYM3_9BILA|nr:unnamed protein product [Rotaria socialis]